MLIPSSVDFVPSTPTSGNRSYNRMGSLVSACIFDLDATLVSSYPGTGQIWYNLETQPADGEPQSGYDFWLGETSASGTNDPTFIGSADSPSASWQFDGGDYFQIASGNSQFLSKYHMATAYGGGTDYGLVVVGRGFNGGSTYGLCGNTRGTAGHGAAVWFLTNNTFRHRNTPGVVDHDSSAACPTSVASNFFAVITHSHQQNKSTYWINKGTSESATHTFASANATNIRFQLFASGSAQFIMQASTRFYAVSMYNKFLTAADVSAIMTEYGTRHGRTYI